MQNTEIIEKLAEITVLLDYEDKKALGNIHNLLEELDRNTDTEVIKAACRSGLQLVEGLILDRSADPERSVDILNRTISVFQQVIVGDTDPDKVKFPEELGIGNFAPADRNIAAPAAVDEEIMTEFLSKQRSVLQEIDELLIGLEKSGEQQNTAPLKSILHTLKGEAAMLGLEEVERVCHKTEDYLESADPLPDVQILFEVKDWLAQAFDSLATDGGDLPAADKLITGLEDSELSEQAAESGSESEEGVPAEIEDAELVADFVNEAREHLETLDQELLDIESDPRDRDRLNTIFRSFHTIKGVAGFLNLQDIRDLSHAAEDLLDSARQGDIILQEAIIDIVFAAVDKLKELIDALQQGLKSGQYPPRERAVQNLILDLKNRIPGGLPETARELPEIVKSDRPQPIPGKEDLAERSTKKKSSPSAGKSQANFPDQKRRKIKVKETIKVDAARLDRLVDTVGELVIAESMVSQSEEVNRIESLDFEKQLGRLNKITRELQEMGTSLRMVPVKATFQKMARLARDLSRKAKKPIDFIVRGEETELDKSVVEKIGDPLVHLIRNAMDHGIEDSPALRRKRGKSEKGRVELRAFHKGGNIFIEVQDDGRGLDREAIVAQAVRRGLLESGEQLSDPEVWDLIFQPGFSTAQKVTEVSGRGVGMDVVRKNIESLRGKVTIESEKDRGATFTIRLPLTLAIIDGMIVGLNSERYIIPTLSVITSLRVRQSEISTIINRGEVIKFQEHLIPLLRLSHYFKTAGNDSEAREGIIVVIESEGKRLGIVADRLIGQQQIVIKSLSSTLKNVEGVSGGAIMPDGKVALILDVGALVRISKNGNGRLAANNDPNKSKSGEDNYE